MQISCAFMIFFSIFGNIFHLKPDESALSCTFYDQFTNYHVFFQVNLEPFLHRFLYQYLLLYTVFYLELWVGVTVII